MFGLVLCLLAALFAIEAKLAWYAPDGNPTAQISAAKLQAADAPRLVAQALSASQFPLELFAVILPLVLVPLMGERARDSHLPAPQFPFQGFSAHHFFRPPPVR